MKRFQISECGLRNETKREDRNNDETISECGMKKSDKK